MLQQVFGYSEFRGSQEEIIQHVAGGGDAFVLMPTGGGKSLCFQIPAMLRDGVGLVISPLIALMRDQVLALQMNGVSAAMLNSSMTPEEQGGVLADLDAGRLDLLYMAPERLLEPLTLARLKRTKLALIAVDEAHCVSHWGHDFRREYLELSVLPDHFPGVPRLALTATADHLTRREILLKLRLGDAHTFAAGFDRPNIRYQVVVKDDPRGQLLDFLNRHHPADSGIVYCLSRNKTESVAAWLNKVGRRAYPYHAGLSAADRQEHQDLFTREDNVIIVATIAFGMGIDKPDVRFVAHLDLPKSIEAYYQETGRAGRDGLPANAWMAYGMSDVVQQRKFIEDSDADEEHKRLEHHKLNLLLGLCESADCRRRSLLSYFGDTLTGNCGNCDNCLNPPESWDATHVCRKALFVAKQTGERYGAGHLIDILLGRTTMKVSGAHHDRLSAFGKGAELTERQWSSVFRQLVSLGYLWVDQEAFGSLRLTREAVPVLRSERTIHIRKDATPSRSTKAKKAAAAAAAVTLSPAEERLYEALRAKRLEICTRLDVPAFTVFHDATLREIAQKRPRSRAALAQITGIGSRKLKTYGREILAVVNQNS